MLCLVIPAFLAGVETGAENRVELLWAIQNDEGAVQAAEAAFQADPGSQSLHRTLIFAYAKSGRHRKAIETWNGYRSRYPDASSDDRLIEEIAWSFISGGSRSSSYITRGIATIAALISQTARGVEVVNRSLNDNSSLIRSVTVQLGSNLRDDILKEKIGAMLEEELVYDVRLEVIGAVGKMKIHSAKDQLHAIIANPASTDEERAAAIASLIHLMDYPGTEEIGRLARSPRTGMRILASTAVLQFQAEESLDEIVPLLDDPNPEVKFAAMIAVTMLAKGEGRSAWIEPLLEGINPQLSATAAWSLALEGNPRGKEKLLELLSHPSDEVRYFTAGCIKTLGKDGVDLMRSGFYLSHDPCIRINLALGLIGQREEVIDAKGVLLSFLENRGVRWMWVEQGIFRYIALSTVSHKLEIPQYPELVDQEVRLELIQTLAFLKDARAQEAIRAFLKERAVGITGIVTALSLTEGDEETIDLVRPLLEDSDPQVRLQAALILAVWGQEESVISHLQRMYGPGSRDIKEKILEGVGHIGSKQSLPFLMDRLNESHQHLRMIAASSVIRCLNH